MSMITVTSSGSDCDDCDDDPEADDDDDAVVTTYDDNGDGWSELRAFSTLLVGLPNSTQQAPKTRNLARLLSCKNFETRPETRLCGGSNDPRELRPGTINFANHPGLRHCEAATSRKCQKKTQGENDVLLVSDTNDMVASMCLSFCNTNFYTCQEMWHKAHKSSR